MKQLAAYVSSVYVGSILLLTLFLVSCGGTTTPDDLVLDTELEVALTGTSPSKINFAIPTGQSRPATFRFRNDTAAPTTYTVTTPAPWITVERGASGSLTPNAVASILLIIDCDISGQSTAVVTITTPTDTKTINVTRFCSGYDITLVFGPNITAAQQYVFRRAAARWKQVIIGDVYDIGEFTKPANDCGSGEPAFNGNVDDLVIYADVLPIDGAGNLLGFAGPCYIRTSDGIVAPFYGTMTFDSADVAALEASGTFKDVILHEMGHVVGIGTLWESQRLVDYAPFTENCSTTSFTTPPVFTGFFANIEYGILGGSGNVPIEDEFGEGTKCGHWDEGLFGSELMTGFIGNVSNPLSRLTVASVQDLGYEVNKNLANAYSIPVPSLQASRVSGINLEGREVLLSPIKAVTSDGKVIPLGQ